MRSKRLGKRNMRLLLVLHILFLMTYMASGLYAMNKLFQEDFVLRYCFMAVIELILWLLADIMVWIASSKGRLVYFVVNIISLYGCYYLWQIFQFPLENLLDRAFVCCSCLLILEKLAFVLLRATILSGADMLCMAAI